MDLVNELMEKDLLFGTLAREAEECYGENRGMAALACLFILAEQAIKFAVNKVDGNFRQCIEEAKTKRLISDEEFRLLDQLRETRNKFFHEYHYAMFWEEGGILYPFSEDETRMHIYKLYSEPCFRIALRLIKA